VLAITDSLDPRTKRLIGDRPVAVYPWDAALAWALDLDWHPLPVIQSYSAYTPSLDRRNADAAASADGPRLILRHAFDPANPDASRPQSIDGRSLAYESPATTLAILCNFRAVRTTENHQLLARTPNRCGPERELGSVTADYGEGVRVPRAHGNEVVLARVSGLAPSGLEWLRTDLYRAAPRYVIFDGGLTYRIVAANAGDGLIMSAPTRLDFPRPWAFAPNSQTVTFEHDSEALTSSGPLRISFYAMPVRPAPEVGLGKG
jgi:hypothetical protein